MIIPVSRDCPATRPMKRAPKFKLLIFFMLKWNLSLFEIPLVVKDSTHVENISFITTILQHYILFFKSITTINFSIPTHPTPTLRWIFKKISYKLYEWCLFQNLCCKKLHSIVDFNVVFVRFALLFWFFFSSWRGKIPVT